MKDGTKQNEIEVGLSVRKVRLVGSDIWLVVEIV